MAMQAGALAGKVANTAINMKNIASIGGSIASLGGLFGKKKNNSAKAAQQQYQYNLALQQQQQDWNEYMYRNRYQMQVEDLEKAGINKLFGLGQAPSVTSGLNSAGMADYVGEQNNKFQQIISALDFGSNLSARMAQQKKVEQETRTEEINTKLKVIEQEEKNLENAMRRIRLKFLPAREKAEIQEMITNSKKNITSAQKDISDIQTSALENKSKERTEEWHLRNPKLSNYLTGIGESSNAIKTILGAVGAGAGFAYMGNKFKAVKNARNIIKK